MQVQLCFTDTSKTKTLNLNPILLPRLLSRRLPVPIVVGRNGIPNDNMPTLHAYRMNRSSSILNESVSPASGDSGDGGDLGYYCAEIVFPKLHALSVSRRLSNLFPFIQRWEFPLRWLEGDQLPHKHGLGVTATFRGPVYHLNVNGSLVMEHLVLANI